MVLDERRGHRQEGAEPEHAGAAEHPRHRAAAAGPGERRGEDERLAALDGELAHERLAAAARDREQVLARGQLEPRRRHGAAVDGDPRAGLGLHGHRRGGAGGSSISTSAVAPWTARCRLWAGK